MRPVQQQPAVHPEALVKLDYLLARLRVGLAAATDVRHARRSRRGFSLRRAASRDGLPLAAGSCCDVASPSAGVGLGRGGRPLARIGGFEVDVVLGSVGIAYGLSRFRSRASASAPVPSASESQASAASSSTCESSASSVDTGSSASGIGIRRLERGIVLTRGIIVPRRLVSVIRRGNAQVIGAVVAVSRDQQPRLDHPLEGRVAHVVLAQNPVQVVRGYPAALSRERARSKSRAHSPCPRDQALRTIASRSASASSRSCPVNFRAITVLSSCTRPSTIRYSRESRRPAAKPPRNPNVFAFGCCSRGTELFFPNSSSTNYLSSA